MAVPVELRLPPWPEWGLVVRSVVLSVSSTGGASLASLEEVDSACGHVWDEIVTTAGVDEVSIEVSRRNGILHLIAVGRGTNLVPDAGEWASRVSAAMMSKLARTTSIARSTDEVRIDVELSVVGG